MNRRPLRPELAAPLGVCPLSQLTEGVDDSSCSLLSGDVAVLSCCIGALLVSFVGAARCAVPTRRPSAFQAGHIPSWRGSCECYALRPGRVGPARALGKLTWSLAPSPRASGGTRCTRPAWTSVRRRIRAPDRGCSSSLLGFFAVLVAAGGPAGGDCQERPEGVSAGNAQHS